jgi:hypothetical protein
MYTVRYTSVLLRGHYALHMSVCLSLRLWSHELRKRLTKLGVNFNTMQTLRFSRGTDEDSGLLEYYVISTGKPLPTFRMIVFINIQDETVQSLRPSV